MNQTALLLNAYYEALHELLEAKKPLLTEKIEALLRSELKNLDAKFNGGKYTAYRDACLAFVDERMETYNPIGIQYTFDHIPTNLAGQLELQLNFYDSRAEFQALIEAARAKAEPDMTDQRLRQMASRLISERGAFPDKSIISAYQADPALPKLPDYIVAKAIEEIINP